MGEFLLYGVYECDLPSGFEDSFAVDPQDEAERREHWLAVIADHLGFSWTGESEFKLKLPDFKDYFLPVTTDYLNALYCRSCIQS